MPTTANKLYILKSITYINISVGRHHFLLAVVGFGGGCWHVGSKKLISGSEKLTTNRACWQ